MRLRNKDISNDQPNQTSPAEEGVEYTGDKGPKFGVRYIQMIISAVGTGIITSTTTTFSILLIAMITEGSSINPDVPYYDFNDNLPMLYTVGMATSLALQLFAGHFGKNGPKWYIVGAALLNGLSLGAIPLAAKWLGLGGVIVCRLIQGGAQGGFEPLSICVGGLWIPSEERARLSFAGVGFASLANMLGSILVGIISKSWMGWPWGFYFLAIINMSYTVIWVLFFHNKPETHPTITPEEKRYIQVSLSQQPGKNIPTPWKKIVLSIPVWAIIISLIGTNFSMVYKGSYKTIFLSEIMKFDIQANGIVQAIPTLVACISGIFVSTLCDLTVKRRWLSRLNARRFFQIFGSTVYALCPIIMTFIPAEYNKWAVVMMSIQDVFLIVFIIGGSNINTFEISPVFAGVIHGMATTCASLVALLAPYIYKWVVSDPTNVQEWRLSFFINALITITSGLIYGVMASVKRQNWEGEAEIEVSPNEARRYSITSVEQAIPKL
ncbi:putative inorganic phosphate cotransporter [Sitophilus oryzae]|uniref:Inorganic phosphate cotransporter n=1 Tax=Sitophilus oryzae TaxID=7048 RepID=A0A6J2XRL5_SITOR|nr:putative inorganic phosphate cotransporter [Sitophilus oryzae]